MKIKIHGRLLALAALMLSTTFCSPKKPPVDEASRANALINDGRYNEAIGMLDPEVRTNPENKQARLLLASAYAARAGIFLANFMELAQEIINDSRNQDAKVISEANLLIYDKLRATAKNSMQRKVVDVAQATFVASIRMKTVVRMFSAVPNAKSPEALVDIETAVQILDGDDYVAGPALYRALLRLILAKYYLQTNVLKGVFNQCSVDFNFLSEQMMDMRKLILPIYKDLIASIMDPERKKPLILAAQRFDVDLANAVRMTKTMGGADANVAFIYKQFNETCEGKK